MKNANLITWIVIVFIAHTGWMTNTAHSDETAQLHQLMERAAQGDADAQNYLGVMYNTGMGVTQDKKEAVEWFKKSAEQGNALAQANLGVMYRDGMGVTQDDEEAVEWWKKAAEQENAIAQYNLGVMYGKGIGVTQSDEKAVYWLKKSAEQGDEDAIEVLKKLEELENNK